MFRTFLILALATCAFAGYLGFPARTSYSYRAPTFSTVAHVPAVGHVYGHGLGYGLGYGYGTYGLGYGLHHGYGLGGLRYLGY
ncbi:hypothetical protein IscW_ISCW024668 [Ixodes scapularis]|uniref:Uncharacterized protein n=1 Tax=Ixodes scapularis TaxID=6945 RepID=B7Q8M8_IXOSC|nr:hypothetical protein IscW_ISCW024668 [Ixodes scapularis]|eukprot:XP_002405274.1 hypothetical protein IscW_ISCW024668 [Ixodes scapularis]